MEEDSQISKTLMNEKYKIRVVQLVSISSHILLFPFVGFKI